MQHAISIYKVGIFRKAYCCSCGITIYGRTFPGEQLKQWHIAQQMEQERWMQEMWYNRYHIKGDI